jgi:glycosyltransferase involved in cell wall biosynthesis
MNAPCRILHIITSLQMGGAEMALYRLVSTLAPEFFQHSVISLTNDQPVGNLIRPLGIPVESLGLHAGSFDPRIVFRLKKRISSFNPDIVQTWMYHADLLGGIAAKLAGSYPVVWNIRHTITDKGSLKASTYLIARTNALLSRFLPVKIICNATAGKQTHVAMGFDENKMLVIENGFDLSQFYPDEDSRDSVRHELGLSGNGYLIGMAGRYNPQKDHATFIRAASLLLQKRQDVYFLLWGNNVDNENLVLTGLIKTLCLQDRVLMLGLRMDTQRLYSSLDIATLSSAYGEAFPQVIGEAMACGVPCVVTDVGDSARVVESTGRVIPPRDPKSLANAWDELLSMPEAVRTNLGLSARERIKSLFSLEATTEKYSQIYQVISLKSFRA